MEEADTCTIDYLYTVLLVAAGAYSEAGKSDTAAILFQKCESGAPTVWDTLNPKRATFHSQLGSFYLAEGRQKEALAPYALAVRYGKQSLGAENSEYGKLLSNYAAALISVGQWQLAESCLQEAKRIIQPVLPPDDPNLLIIRMNEAVLLKQKGLLYEARNLFETLLPKIDKVFDPGSLFVGMARYNLATLYNDLGESQKAAALMKLTVSKMSKKAALFGFFFADYGTVLLNQQRFDEAEAIFLEALDIPNQSTFGRLAALRGLGRVAGERQQFRQAFDYAHMADSLARTLLGENHYYRNYLLDGLAQAARGLGLFEQAEEFHLEAMQVLRQSFGIENMDFFTSLSSYAQTLAAQKKGKEAFAIFQQAAELQHKLINQQFESMSEEGKRLFLNRFADSQDALGTGFK